MTGKPSDVREESGIVGTVLEAKGIGLMEVGVDEAQAVELHARLA